MKKKRATDARLLTEQLRSLIANAPVTRYEIAKQTGISQATLSRFVNGQRVGMSMTNLDQLGKYLRLTITSAGPIEGEK